MDGVMELNTSEIDLVAGGSIPGAVFTGLVLGTVLIGGYVLWDSWVD